MTENRILCGDCIERLRGRREYEQQEEQGQLALFEEGTV